LLVGAGTGLRGPASGRVGALGTAEPLAGAVGAAVALALSGALGAPASLGLADAGSTGSMVAVGSGAESLDVASEADLSGGFV
jgi:hypothetical protein